jgi:hypothetical protein
MTLTLAAPVFKGETCRACAKPLVFVPTEKGKREPLEAESVLLEAARHDRNVPATAIRVVASLDGAPAVSRGLNRSLELGLLELDSLPVHVAHFATCPDRDRFRRRG